MKYKVGWRDFETKGEMVIEAETFYGAKMSFLKEKLRGTTWENAFIASQWVPFVYAKSTTDRRCKESLPEGFSLKTFLKEAGA